MPVFLRNDVAKAEGGFGGGDVALAGENFKFQSSSFKGEVAREAFRNGRFSTADGR
jgi:hypothetical protein